LDDTSFNTDEVIFFVDTNTIIELKNNNLGLVPQSLDKVIHQIKVIHCIEFV